MALRLRVPDPPTAPTPPEGVTLAPTSAASARRPGLELAARAVGVLAQGETDRYAALFGEARRLEDEHDRYEARRRLAEAMLAHGPQDRRAAVAGFLAMAAGTIAALEDEPREPLLLNHAGVALYELGGLAGAKALFQAARRLDPTLAHVERNLAEVRRRRKAGLTGPVVTGAQAPALRALEHRARKVAAGARPRTDLTISLCMIVRDEEAMLGRCLSAVREAVDEIVVVDTGSTDGTVAIAESFGARVLHHRWTGDFAAARNVSLDAATGDWLLYLDADEVLCDGEAPRLRALAGRSWREALYLVETNHTGDLEDASAVTHDALRLLRNRPAYRFEGRVHEQFAHRLPPGVPERLERTDVRLEHFGYLGEVRQAKDKGRRNLELLRAQVAEGEDGPFLHFNLGSEHAAAGDPATAARHFRRAWDALRGDPAIGTYGFVPALGSRLCAALRQSGASAGELDRVADEVLATLPGFTDVVFEQALACRAQGDVRRARSLLERCVAWGDAPSAFSPTRGCGTFLARAQLAELDRAEGDLAAAEAHLRDCLRDHPGFPGALEPFAAVLLARGEPAPDVVAEAEALCPTPTPSQRFLLAVALHEAGAVVEAEDQLRAVLRARPSSAPARAALVEALLSQARWADAEAEGLAIEPASAAAPAAARAAAFARLAASGLDAEARRDALTLVRSLTALDDADRRVLEAWASPAGPPPTLPAECGPVLLAMLEALLRVEAVDAYAALVPCLDALDVPERDRREAHAQVLLRRGFLESAADEWIAVVQGPSGPDAAAFAGLAWVAIGRGLAQDARELADAALSLDPGCTRARDALAAAGRPS